MNDTLKHRRRYYETVRVKMLDARNSISSTPSRGDSTRPSLIGRVFETLELPLPLRRHRSLFDGRINVLIVDDSEDQLQLLKRHFEIAGCTVIVAATAEAAMVAYQEMELDLAVVDLMLPGMTGWEFTAALQSDHPDCPVAISSVLGEEDYPNTEAALPKPVNRESVRQVLSRCVPRWVAP